MIYFTKVIISELKDHVFLKKDILFTDSCFFETMVVKLINWKANVLNERGRMCVSLGMCVCVCVC